jgi:hypothetical protein
MTLNYLTSTSQLPTAMATERNSLHLILAYLTRVHVANCAAERARIYVH